MLDDNDCDLFVTCVTELALENKGEVCVEYACVACLCSIHNPVWSGDCVDSCLALTVHTRMFGLLSMKCCLGRLKPMGLFE